MSKTWTVTINNPRWGLLSEGMVAILAAEYFEQISGRSMGTELIEFKKYCHGERLYRFKLTLTEDDVPDYHGFPPRLS